ncbi:hypothetical protein CANARDRAFT_5162 [[Candida] arabinofermentans NRRL YB-2248]|uniref:Trafficking protein particle complex II-specific subunit 65 IgD3 domain-containing protein n=1 Tax=[Candida] arabinofermentans NRRL YB-2248 TaxID=983967 RepID=A0A1E4T7X0_9ASCO|nr:hypothetical protein CANARDRAFT_5162 [[Candida] arabinofermentans NRRL YB-2248]
MTELQGDEGIQIVIPNEVIKLEDKLQILDQLETCTSKSIAYFDEAVKIYVITHEEGDISDLNLDVIYSTRNKKTYKLTNLIFEDSSISVWEFETMITPDKLSNELIFKVYYNKVLQQDNNHLENLKLVDSLMLAGSKLSKLEKHGQLISHSKSVRISPIFQMKFKTIKTEKILTSLELNLSGVIRDLGYEVVISSISIRVQNCDIAQYSKIDYPLTLPATSTLNLTYKLSNNDSKHIKPIVVTINSTINGDKSVATRWITNIDFQSSPAIQSQSPFVPAPHSATPSPNPNAYLQHKVRSTNSALALSKRASSRMHSTSSVTLNNAPKRNLHISISGQTKVKLGEIFRWKLQLINKSNENMNLILYIQSSITKTYEKSVPPIPMQHSNANSGDPIPLYSIAQLVKSFYNKMNTIGLISLTNNVKINLESGQLFETELELIGIEKGLVNLRDFKVLEINSGEVFECGKLLDVLVV